MWCLQLAELTPVNVHSFIKQDAAEPRSPHKVAGHLWYSPSLDCFCCNAAYGNCPSALPVVWCCSQQPADMPESGCVLAIQEGICFTSAQRVCRLTQPSAARVQLPAQMQRCMSTLTASSPSSFSCAQCCSSRHMGQCKAAAFSSGPCNLSGTECTTAASLHAAQEVQV